MEVRVWRYVSISAIGTSALIVVIPAAGSIPCSRPRRELRSPLTAPTASSGTGNSSSLIGSRSTGLGLRIGLLEGHRAGDLERHLGGVDRVVGAVDEQHTHALHGRAGELAVVH